MLLLLTRRHCAIFPPGVLDKHYEKLMQCDQQLFELSQKPFPSLESPFFNTACSMPFDVMISRLSVNFNGVGPRFSQVAQYYPYPAYATASRAAPVQPSQNPTRTGIRLAVYNLIACIFYFINIYIVYINFLKCVQIIYIIFIHMACVRACVRA